MACLVQKSSSGVESSNSSTWTPLYGGARLDQDTIQYFHKFYCKDCRMEKQAAERAKASAAAGGDNGGVSSAGGASGQPASPRNSLEELSLQQTMDKNKECLFLSNLLNGTHSHPDELPEMYFPPCRFDATTALKRKLMLRRSVNELVDQGIYPPLKTPPAYAEQRKQLERAKTGDLLRHKIQHRPDRESLVNQHILEDTKVDPSLQDRQRQLKRARLADGLNDKLSHRPGPLELVQGNILQTNEELAEAIKGIKLRDISSKAFFKTSKAFLDLNTFNFDFFTSQENFLSSRTFKKGLIKFQRTTDGEELDHRVKQQFTCEEESNSDEALSPTQEEDSNLSDIGSPGSSIASNIDFGSLITRVANQGPSTPSSKTTVTIPPGQPYAVPSGHSVVGNRQTSSTHSSNSRNGNSSSSNQHKSRPKKPKPKTQPKAKVIKFHEYKGPPNIVKNIQNAAQNLANNSETPYHILLQQQQLFLQWQLEFQQKNLLASSTAVAAAAAVATAPKVGDNQHVNASGNMMVTVSASTPSPVATTTLSQPMMRQSPSPSVPQKHQHQPQQTPPPPPPPPPLPQQQQQQQHHHHQHHITMIPQTQIHQNQISHPSPCPSPAHHQLQQQQQQQQQQQVVNVNNPALLKPLSNLEEMKVADLRAELKKRNLTVSGSKPQLIERLRNFIETKSNNTPSSPTTTTSTSTTTITNQIPSSILDNNSNISQPAIQAVVYATEESMLTNVSPPTSPNSKETSNQTLSNMSIDKLDISTNFLMHKNHLNNAMSNVPMTVDQISRPPSVAPGENAPMDIDHVNSQNDLGQNLTSAPKAVGVVSPQQQMQPQVGNQQRGVMGQEELVKQQQKKIEELQRQLHESQLQLHLQLQQHQLKIQLQQQQQQQSQQQQQTQQTNLIKQQQQPQSPAQVMSVQSPAQVMNVQSPAQVMTVHSPPQVMTMHSPPHVMTVHSPQMMNMHSPQQILNVQSPQQILNVQSPPQIINPQSPSHQVLTAQPPSHILMNLAADSKVPLPPPLPQTPSLQVQQSLSSIALTSIPISAHLIQTSTQSVQPTQSLPTMIVTTSTTGPDIKPNFNDLFNKQQQPQQQAQQQQQPQKSPGHAVDLAKLALSPSQTVTPFILSVSQANSREGSPSPNSLICSSGMSLASLSSSPLPVVSLSESTQVTSALGTQPAVSIDSSNSTTAFFSIPLREPPKYDEAVKNKHQITQGPLFVTMQDGGNNTLPSSVAPTSVSSETPPISSAAFSISTKSQAMDDVLEILIRNGELPPSAAQEPPPTPKTTAQTSTIPTVSVTQTAAAATSSNTPFSLATVLMPSPSLTTNSTSSSLVNQRPVVSATVPAPTPVLVKQEPDASPPSSSISCDTNREFVDINEVLTHDFNSMDWTSEGGFTNLDLPDSFTDHKIGTSTLPIITKTDASNPGSSTDLGVTLDLPHDTDNSCNMQIDVSDWLDVVIPSTGFAPASLNTPISFTSSDPILTPKTQQDVLDMFSFDDTDFTASSDSQCGMDWDKLTDPSTSSS